MFAPAPGGNRRYHTADLQFETSAGGSSDASLQLLSAVAAHVESSEQHAVEDDMQKYVAAAAAKAHADYIRMQQRQQQQVHAQQQQQQQQQVNVRVPPQGMSSDVAALLNSNMQVGPTRFVTALTMG
jgi:hypothetical protein